MADWAGTLLAGAACGFALHYWFEWRDPDYRQSYREMRYRTKSPLRHFREHAGKEIAFAGVILATIVLIQIEGGEVGFRPD